MSSLTELSSPFIEIVLKDLLSFMSSPSHSDVALPVAAMKVMLNVIKRSKAITMTGLLQELETAKEGMLGLAASKDICGFRSHIPLQSGCELFMRYVTRSFYEMSSDFELCIKEVLLRGETFAGMSLTARQSIAEHGCEFIREGQVILTHGYSRVVASLLKMAAEKQKKNFSVIVLEGRPEGGGARAAAVYSEANIPVTVVLDSAMGYAMEKADLVIVGAEGVVENGGVVNKIGTYALGITAKALNTPFYVAAESYKFARLYPLNQADLPRVETGELRFADTTLPGKLEEIDVKKDLITVDNCVIDYTPANYITLLFTDLGVLTPSAISDELIRLYA
ncbi:hypothetical protein TrVE_jg10190 [Triparma verrucosa]|uniref:Translation initiation factor eIF2B subunit alpha n=2 Tax=Triparma TaxID=722752 RepID=A0A9W6ZGF3_9STRA|nr:hypothetical protein TrST_g11903 [Triparma strigata]GMH84920.1 hypothetical protein TrVE_jg10190 [Triparma verrucosa]